MLRKSISIPSSNLQLNLGSILRPHVDSNTDLAIFSFTFLNQKHSFSKSVDWNYSALGKLWCYNLNYFDFLWSKESDIDVKLQRIKDFVSSLRTDSVGLDPYCISLRTVNWVKFLTQHKINDPSINASLYMQLLILTSSKEYHIMGNHLLENGFSLLFGAYFFKSRKFYDSAKTILQNNLPNQILSDGGHYELSPMYHQIVLGRLLDSYSLIQSNTSVFKDDLEDQLKGIIIKMHCWLNEITFSCGSIPYVNDSAPNISFKTEELNRVAQELRIPDEKIELGESGYRKLVFYTEEGSVIEALIDIGSIKADEQPGHSHSDIFSFIVFKDGKPFIVDTGISTYNNCPTRLLERLSKSHNTVSIEGVEPIEVWSGFRVARRPKVTVAIDSRTMIKASHDGYKRIGVEHQRIWKLEPNKLVITDDIKGKTNRKFNFNLHFHPNTIPDKINDDTLRTGQATIKYSSEHNEIQSYGYAAGFNEIHKASKSVSVFRQRHQAVITF